MWFPRKLSKLVGGVTTASQATGGTVGSSTMWRGSLFYKAWTVALSSYVQLKCSSGIKWAAPGRPIGSSAGCLVGSTTPFPKRACYYTGPGCFTVGERFAFDPRKCSLDGVSGLTHVSFFVFGRKGGKLAGWRGSGGRKGLRWPPCLF